MMKVKMSNLFYASLTLFLYTAVYLQNAFADDDVAALVVDNGSGMSGGFSVPEPATWSLLLAGAVGAGLVTWRNRKNK